MNYTFDNKELFIFGLIFLIIILVIILVILQLYQSYQIENYYQIQNKKIPDNVIYESPGLIQSYNPMNVDVVRQYDYHKTFDPLEDPTRRVPRHEIPPVVLKHNIDIPSRGYPDNYNQYGVLVKEHSNKDGDSENRIVRLFGRQRYPGSNQYEYYTMITSGNDLIKIPINNKRRNELYDDDIIYIKELNNNYKVQLYKYDAPRYYPDLF